MCVPITLSRNNNARGWEGEGEGGVVCRVTASQACGGGGSTGCVVNSTWGGGEAGGRTERCTSYSQPPQVGNGGGCWARRRKVYRFPLSPSPPPTAVGSQRLLVCGEGGEAVGMRLRAVRAGDETREGACVCVCVCVCRSTVCSTGVRKQEGMVCGGGGGNSLRGIGSICCWVFFVVLSGREGRGWGYNEVGDKCFALTHLCVEGWDGGRMEGREGGRWWWWWVGLVGGKR